MRIRGYDEETEEYSEGIVELMGEVANLTKTASTPGGISLFELGDPEQYRSTYDILADISKIWDEITDKQQAELLEVLFGKMRAQVGASILSNFKQAENAIVSMANSAGNAEAEMENIYDSLDYKLNQLSETWVGVSKNLFQSDDIERVIELLIRLSETVANLTESFGLFGTLTAGLFIKQLASVKKSVGRPKMTGFRIVPTYALVVTRNELMA